jgi:hypothetical protein
MKSINDFAELTRRDRADMRERLSTELAEAARVTRAKAEEDSRIRLHQIISAQLPLQPARARLKMPVRYTYRDIPDLIAEVTSERDYLSGYMAASTSLREVMNHLDDNANSSLSMEDKAAVQRILDDGNRAKSLDAQVERSQARLLDEQDRVTCLMKSLIPGSISIATNLEEFYKTTIPFFHTQALAQAERLRDEIKALRPLLDEVFWKRMNADLHERLETYPMKVGFDIATVYSSLEDGEPIR